jgi:hypothetical protein
MTNHKHSKLLWLAVAACTLLAASPARAQTITALSPTPTSSTGSTTVAKPVGQSQLVGATSSPLPSTTAPEAIIASGAGRTTSTVSVDPNGGSSVVELYFDMSNVALKGAKSLQAYHTTGQGRITRVLAAADTYVATLPIWTTNAAGKTSYYTMTATFNMTFNTTTNVMTGINVAFGDFVAPATAGGVAIGGAIQ